MEQKRTLWIIAAAGLFLLVVVGAALILYSPSLHNTNPVQASYAPQDGWVSVPKADISATSPQETALPVSEQSEVPPENNLPFTPYENQSALQEQTQDAGQQIKAENVTVIADNTNVITAGTTTIDLNSLKLNQNVTAQNDYTSNQMKEARPQSEPQAKTAKTQTKQESKPKAAQTKQAVSTKSAAKTPSKTVKTAEPVSDSYFVQVASYTGRKSADDAREKLEANKIPSNVYTYKDAKGTEYFRVRVGPFSTKTEAEYWKKAVMSISDFSKTESYIVNPSAKTSKK